MPWVSRLTELADMSDGGLISALTLGGVPGNAEQQRCGQEGPGVQTVPGPKLATDRQSPPQQLQIA